MSTTYDTHVDRAQPEPVAAARAATPPSHLKFRPDIEGMRAIAVTLVVLSHAGIPGLAGGYVGVDVFFVISGFLITTLLLGELRRTGTVSLARFYARRATRLLPASTLVLLVTVVASWLWLPATRFKSVSLDAIYATFYGINWRLASEGVDYLNADAEPSPLQHFWSLAVEEQFYLIWPLLLLIFALTWGRRHNVERRGPVVVALAVVVVASLLVSITQTTSAAPWAYFGAHTRAWELGIGALVAVGAAALSGLSRPLAAGLTWAGLAAVVVSAVLYDEQTAFPGFAAALPVLGAAAIIAGGCASPRGGAVTLLGTWPFQQIGKYSYGWYLWHWPILMIVPHALGVEATITLNLVLAAVSLVLAVASYHLVENLVRNQAWLKRKSIRGLALGLGLSAAAAMVAQVGALHPPKLATGAPAVNTAQAVASAADPEAEIRRIISESTSVKELPSNITPKVEKAKWNEPAYYKAGCHLNFVTVGVDNPCMFGDPNGTETVYLFGDSHAAHWYPALNDIAQKRGWKLMVRTKSACQAPVVRTFSPILKRPYDECMQWRDQVLAEIKQTKPMMVVMSSNGNDSGGMVDDDGNKIQKPRAELNLLWAETWAATFREIKSPQTKLVMIEDTPWPGQDAPACLAEHAKNMPRCYRPTQHSIAFADRRVVVAEAARAHGVTVIDATPWFCAESCPMVVGNILVWKDNGHITTKYARMLAPLLEAKLPI